MFKERVICWVTLACLLLGMPAMGAAQTGPRRLTGERVTGPPAIAGVNGPLPTAGAGVRGRIWTAEPVAQMPGDAWTGRARSGRTPAAADLTPTTPNVDVVTLADTGIVPPDTMGDIGPEQYLVAVNGRIRTIAKDTGAADTVIDDTLDAFFDTASGGAGTNDPRVRYDRMSGRWFVTAVTLTLPSSYLLAVSSDATLTPSTTWTFYSWANTRLSTPDSHPCVADYPTLGVDEDALYIGANQYCGTSPGSEVYDSTSGYVIRKAALLDASPSLQITAFDELAVGSGAGLYSPQGVDNFDTGTDAGYFIGVDNAGVGGPLQLVRVQDPGGTPSLSAPMPVAVAPVALPIPVPHPGSLDPLDAQDDRLQRAIIRHGLLWTNHHLEVDETGLSVIGGGRTAIRWYAIGQLATAPAVQQSGTVYDPAATDPVSYFVGSLVATGQGHVALGATAAGAADHVNAIVTGRLASDAAGSMDVPTAVTTNTSFTYNRSAAPQRWGDQSATSLDPDDDMTVWTLQQYVDAEDSYALRLVKLQAPPPAQLTSVSPSTIRTNRTGLVLVVNATSAGGSGFYDPGAGFPARLSAAFSGTGLTITSVTVTSPTSLTLTVNTVGAEAGPRTLTVTNPDGQTTVLAAAVTLEANAVPVAQADAYATAFNTPLVVSAPGVLSNDSDGNGDTLTAVLVTGPANGTLNLLPTGGFTYTPQTGFVGADAFTYRASDGEAQSTPAAVTINVAGPTDPQPATNLYTFSVSGNTVTLRWTPPSLGPAPTGYVVEGGIAPGEVLASLPTNNTAPVYTFVAPTGSFRVRVHTLVSGARSIASNEIMLHVNVPVAPSAPDGLTALVNGSTLGLTWRNTFEGGAPAGLRLDVTGSLTTSISLGRSEQFAFTGVPAGTYTLQLRALNAAGISQPSAPVTVTFPGACTGAPQAPEGFLAYRVGNIISAIWLPPATGPAPSSYVVNVSGAFTGTFGTTARGISSAAGPGSYTISVAAVNACGTSAATPTQVVVMP